MGQSRRHALRHRHGACALPLPVPNCIPQKVLFSMDGMRQMILRFAGWLEGQPRLALLAAPALILALTAYADFRLPDEASLGIFYVFPPLLLAIAGRANLAILLAVAAAAA